MKKFYVEILHPFEKKVLWHYYAEAESEEALKEAVGKQVAVEHADGFLLDTGGLFLITVEDDKRDEQGKWPEKE